MILILRIVIILMLLDFIIGCLWGLVLLTGLTISTLKVFIDKKRRKNEQK